jgi:hypothetical protein
MGHVHISPRECPWRGIIVRVIYMFTRLKISCPFIPSTVDINSTDQLQEWLSKDPGDYQNYPFHNGLKLFLWIINKVFQLEYDDMYM